MRPHTALLAAVLLVATLTAAPAQAVDSPTADPAFIQDGRTIILILDGSAGMSETDPDDLRLSAARLLVDLLQPGDRLGVVSFDDRERTLASPQELGAIAERSSLKALIETILPRGASDIKGALEAAFTLLAAQGAQRDEGLVILVSGSAPHVAEFAQGASIERQYMDGLWARVDAFAQRGWSIHTIALEHGVLDARDLEQLALQTGGSFQSAPAQGLPRALSRMADALHLRQQVLDAAVIWQAEPNVQSFAVSAGTEWLAVTASAPGGLDQLELLDPEGRVVEAGEGVAQHTADHYTLILVEEPVVGEWRAISRGSGEGHVQASVLLDVRLALLAPLPHGRVPQAIPLTARVALVFDEAPADLQGWQLTARSALAGEEAGQTVALTPTGETAAAGRVVYYGGQLDALHELGRYGLEVQALRAGAAAAAQTYPLRVDGLPYLRLQEGPADRFRIGQELALRVQFARGAAPVTVGGDLELDVLQAWVHAGETGRIQVVPLRPSGANGEPVGAGSAGEWAGADSFTARLSLDQVGAYQVGVRARGQFAGAPFAQTLPAGAFQVVPLSTIGWSLDQDALRWLVPGRTLPVTITFTSDSFEDETVEIVSPQVGDITIAATEVTVLADQASTAQVQVAIADDVPLGERQLVVFALTDASGVVMAPPSRELDARLVTPWAYLWHRYSWLLLVAGGAAAAAMLYFVLGGILYWVKVRRRVPLVGRLAYAAVGDGELADELDFSQKRTYRFVVAADPAGTLAETAGTEEAAAGAGGRSQADAAARGAAAAGESEGGQQGRNLLAREVRQHLAAETPDPEPAKDEAPAEDKALAEDEAPPAPAERPAPAPDLTLPLRERPFAFALERARPEAPEPWYKQGWQSLGRDPGAAPLEVTGLERTRLVMDGFIRVQAQLGHGDAFDVGGYRFTYHHPHGPDAAPVAQTAGESAAEADQHPSPAQAAEESAGTG